MSNEQQKSDYATVMSHFYRGELGRMIVWRERFDTTTHWAVITVTGIITFAWTNDAPSHFMFILSNIILYLLLNIEARRYRFYDAYRARVRILEAHFIFPHLTQIAPLEGNWRELLGNDLMMPSFKISKWEALSRRLNRNYIWLFLITLVAWIGQLIHTAGSVTNFDEMKLALAQGLPLSLPIFLVLAAAFYLYIAILSAIGVRGRKASGQFQTHRHTDSKEWTL